MKFAALKQGETFIASTPDGDRTAQVGRLLADGQTGELFWIDSGEPVGQFTRADLIAAGFRPAKNLQSDTPDRQVRCDLFSNRACVLPLTDLMTARAEGQSLAAKGNAVHIEIYSNGAAPMHGERYDTDLKAWVAIPLPV